MSVSGNQDDRRIFLCLSGGGFRATFFHLGVLKYLHDARNDSGQRLLDRVSNVFSVSGGSIAAAHLSLNWKQYEDDFEGTAVALVRFGQSDVKWRILRSSTSWLRLPFPPRFTLSLESIYEQDLYRSATLENLDVSGGPRFYLLGTDLTAGEAFWFSEKGFHVREPDAPFTVIRARSTFRLARAVAASCALPPYLRPVLIEGEKDMDPSAESHGRAFALRERWVSDGGIYDNIGLSAAFEVSKDEKSLGAARFVVSDASSTFRVQPHLKYRIPVMRPLDILMNRVAQLERRQGEVQRVVIDRAMGELPTDIRAFSNEEIRLLVWDGYEKAATSFRNTDESYVAKQPSWDPCPARWWQLGQDKRKGEPVVGTDLNHRIHQLTRPDKPTNLRGEVWALMIPLLRWVFTKIRCHPAQIAGLATLITASAWVALLWFMPNPLPTIVEWSSVLPPGLELASTEPKDFSVSADGELVAVVARAQEVRQVLLLSRRNSSAAMKVTAPAAAKMPVFRSDSKYVAILSDSRNSTPLLSIKDLPNLKDVGVIRTLPAGVRCADWHRSVFAFGTGDGIFAMRLPEDLAFGDGEFPVTPRVVARGNLGCPRITDDGGSVIFEESATESVSIRRATIDGSSNNLLIAAARSPTVVGDRVVYFSEGSLKSCALRSCDTGQNTVQVHAPSIEASAVSRLGAMVQVRFPPEPKRCVYEFVPTRGSAGTKIVCAEGPLTPLLFQSTELCINGRDGTQRFSRRNPSSEWRPSGDSCEGLRNLRDQGGAQTEPPELCRVTDRTGLVAAAYDDRIEIQGPSSERVQIQGASEPVWDLSRPRGGTLYFRKDSSIRYWQTGKPAEGVPVDLRAVDGLSLVPTKGGCRETYDFLSGFLVVALREPQGQGVSIAVSQLPLLRQASEQSLLQRLRDFLSFSGPR